MEIRELESYTYEQFRQLRVLMTQLSERIVLDENMLHNVLDAPDSHLYVLLDGGVIIGCATLCLFRCPSGFRGTIEDVVVSEEYRGRHLGRRLMTYLIDEASKSGIDLLQLTSRPSRLAANSLYQSLGFQRKNTNCYTLQSPFSTRQD
ncbi:MAG: GNAT family N-acetyltransferase [Bacteroidaceae bacterium]|nr:GNAT family N-acetyltransferase [Bacteroidaceae bacterium]